ncbi:lysophospholipid acyltransferase family protein, partial [Enterococcus faecalis]|uniref:lysophospholipid acyltransferase family protein n=1 Tax=Enterococcus faecalis TaxID=1351 RepID=UPI003D6BCCFE
NGVSLIYGEAGVPCIPVALNSGLFWPRRTFLRYPGTIVIEFLDPIPPGLKRHDFNARLQAAIEEASDRLERAGREEQVRL